MPGLRLRGIAAAIAATAAVLCAGCSNPADPSAMPPIDGLAGTNIGVDEALHDSLPAEIRDAGVVRVATDVPYAPFEMFASDGSDEIVGLDYDLGQALARTLGVRFDFSRQAFDGIIPAIQAGKFDIVMSAMTDTTERQGVLDFVDYSVSGSGILVSKGNPNGITTLTDLCGHAVAVQSGSKQAKMLTAEDNPCRSAGKPDAAVAQKPKDTDAQLALMSGQVVADFMDKPAAGYAARTANSGSLFEVVDDARAPGGTDATPNGIGIGRGRPELTEAIRRALQRLIDDGTYTQILEAWGESGIAIDTATVNAGKS
ncbi:ABC transporter substrate-binding protein [Mycolicibacterium hodleri]|uniref:ABC transporter substrate-binding protein n=1 Tax=Mycolicibacterium hodleri TaxID=49897 RepID=A0A502EEK7_9MYCO|nr:ABC transporter substrate-binding protein [Mycolicibacterium hodleri]TPG34936.1 ABC transporter substrate-binding protein [Mycolicibacterium hodleri]